MTITVRKLHLGIAVLAIALIVPGTSYATHVFRDVPDDRFFSVPVEWAWDNGLTTGSPAGSGNFLPFENVTRAENITFNYRYDDLIVQPALDAVESDVSAAEAALSDRYTKSETDAAIAAAGGDDLAGRVEASTPAQIDNWNGSTRTESASITAPRDGFLHVLYTAGFTADADATSVDPELYSIEVSVDGALWAFDVPILDFGSLDSKTITLQATVPVTGGSHTVAGSIERLTGPSGALTFLGHAVVSAQFVPLDGSGGPGPSPLSISTVAADQARMLEELGIER